ncbi:hypothetical protein [Shinella zoogloeoides]|uniref:hypothetical protein n=1 Tax=Shinella zoogloeoides TaxID=352475 RepID=UPI001F59CA5D|nr:hypothetical protein [Shinella zoogloeoides]
MTEAGPEHSRSDPAFREKFPKVSNFERGLYAALIERYISKAILLVWPAHFAVANTIVALQIQG